MSAGMGIFLAGVVIAMAILLVNETTRKAFVKIAGWVIALLLIAGAIGGAFMLYGYLKTAKLEKNPDLDGVRIGDLRNDVIYRKGNPRDLADKRDRFDHYGENLLVGYKDGRVDMVVYLCTAGGLSVSINGIHCGDYDSKIKAAFKNKYVEICDPDKPTHRTLFLEDAHTEYGLRQGKVQTIGLVSKDRKFPDDWVDCRTGKPPR